MRDLIVFKARGGTGLIAVVRRLALITLREITMLDIMNTLTDKPGWEDKASLIYFTQGSYSLRYCRFTDRWPPSTGF
jgi:hypothetical protein